MDTPTATTTPRSRLAKWERRSTLANCRLHPTWGPTCSRIVLGTPATPWDWTVEEERSRMHIHTHAIRVATIVSMDTLVRGPLYCGPS